METAVFRPQSLELLLDASRRELRHALLDSNLIDRADLVEELAEAVRMAERGHGPSNIAPGNSHYNAR